jgi:hypothetical protein
VAGIKPPSPTVATTTPRTFDNQIPATARDTDPLAESNASIAIDKQRADFRPNEFSRVILQHGKRLVWRKAMLCPCLREESGQADLDCSDCDGSGFVYVDPLSIQAHMASFSKNTRIYEKFGLWQTGEVQVTVQQAYRLGYRDSLEMLDDLMSFDELIEKGDRRGRKSALDPGVDSARYRITHLTKALVRSGNDSIPLEVGYHIEVDENGHLKWTAPGNSLVPDKSFVSLRYDFHPVWIVISHPHAQRSDVRGTKTDGPADVVDGLPLQIGAQLDFLADVNTKLPVTGPVC